MSTTPSLSKQYASRRRSAQDGEPAFTAGDTERIADIFETPLQGRYSWDYTETDARIRKLYRLGKERNWNADAALDWNFTLNKAVPPVHVPPVMTGWHEFDALSPTEQLAQVWEGQSWALSQYLHGEQGALLVASQLVSCAPTYDGKLYASSQTFDEARHVETFARYVREKVECWYDVNPCLKSLLDKILIDERWDLKFIGMQLVIETLALSAFDVQRTRCSDPFLARMLELVSADEARHVGFGVGYLRQLLSEMSEAERNERAVFAYECCCVMREGIVPTDVFSTYGWDLEGARAHYINSDMMRHFRSQLLTRLIPNLKKVGLITDEVRPLYEKLGALGLENAVDEADIDWTDIERPLPALGT